jgi:hypothetical protein
VPSFLYSESAWTALMLVVYFKPRLTNFHKQTLTNSHDVLIMHQISKLQVGWGLGLRPCPPPPQQQGLLQISLVLIVYFETQLTSMLSPCP